MKFTDEEYAAERSANELHEKIVEISDLESQLAEAERTITEVRGKSATWERAFHDALAERDEARRVVVWVVKHKAYVIERDEMLYWSGPGDFLLDAGHDGTDADIYRALKEAMGE